MRYRSGEEIRPGDRIILHGNRGSVEFIVDDPDDMEWGYLGIGVIVSEPKEFGHLFLTAEQLADYEDLEFAGRLEGISE